MKACEHPVLQLIDVLDDGKRIWARLYRCKECGRRFVQ